MMLKMIVEFEDGQDPKSVMQDVLENCKKVEDDCEIFLQNKNFHRRMEEKADRIDSKTYSGSARENPVFSLEQRIWICKSLG